MSPEALRKLFADQILQAQAWDLDPRAANEPYYEQRRGDKRLFYYVRTYPNNQLKLEVRELWESDLPTSGELFKNGWPADHGIIPQLDPRK